MFCRDPRQLAYVLVTAMVLPISSLNAQNVTTQAYNNGRTGSNLQETILSPHNVTLEKFGRLYERNVDGEIQAQPLYVRNVEIPGRGRKNLIIIASQKNKLYAFDAKNFSKDPSQGLVWSRQLNSSRRLLVGDGGAEICFETYSGFVGITSTPVIDVASGTIFAVSWRPRMANLNLFVTDGDGAVKFSGWLGPAPGYHPWSPISNLSFATPGQPVTAVWSNPEHLDLFVVGRDGAVWSTWWEGEKSWQSWHWFRISPLHFAQPGQTVTALWSNKDHLDLFVTTSSGIVKSTFWEANPAPPLKKGWQDWFPIKPQFLSPLVAPQEVSAVWTPEGGPVDIGGNYLHAIDLTTGAERRGSPVKLAPDPRCHRNRPGLLLSHQVVYVGLACLSCDWNCGDQPYHGWVLAYKTSDLSLQGTFNTSPQHRAVGIWQSGSGLVADSDDNIYFETGNDLETHAPLADSFVKIHLNSSGLQLINNFRDPNTAILSTLNSDTDLGSGGPVLLSGGKLIGGGKEGKLYLIDTASMTADQQFLAFENTWHNVNTNPPCCDANSHPAGCNSSPSCYVSPARYKEWQPFGPNIHAGMVFWPRPSKNDGLLYKMPEKDYLKAFRYDLSSHKVSTNPFLNSDVRPPDGMPGGFSSLSANGERDGIVWTSFPNGDATGQTQPGSLVAFDATNLHEIWRDPDPESFAKFVPPTVADGMVFRATFSGKVVVYGLQPPGTMHKSACYSIEGKYRSYGGELGILGASTGGEIRDSSGGMFRNYQGTAMATHLSAPPAGKAISTAHVDEDHPLFMASTPITSSIYWSPQTCAHVLNGDIRASWIRLGGPRSKLGYPTTDEMDSPDGKGRVSRFQRGEIWWYPDRGAFVK
jgi:hypothetical protein